MACMPSVAGGAIFNGKLSELKYSIWLHLKTDDDIFRKFSKVSLQKLVLNLNSWALLYEVFTCLKKVSFAVLSSFGLTDISEHIFLYMKVVLIAQRSGNMCIQRHVRSCKGPNTPDFKQIIKEK